METVRKGTKSLQFIAGTKIQNPKSLSVSKKMI